MSERSIHGCPSCGAPGREVPDATVQAMLPDESGRGTPTGYRFCDSASCEVVYFRAGRGDSYRVGNIRVSVFQKSDDPSRPVCYCFDHTVADVVSELRRMGRNTVLDEVVAKCREGLDRCELENPQGTCCIGNIRKVEAAAVKTTGSHPASTCCP